MPKDYSSFDSVELACDELFVKWVKYPENHPDLDRFWKDWLKRNPHKTEEVNEAREFILAVLEDFVDTEGQQTRVWRKITDSVNLSPTKQDDQPNKSKWSVLRIAAALVILLGVGYLIKKYAAERDEISTNEFAFSPQIVQSVENNTESPKTITLADSTSVVLQPNSKIQYPSSYSTDSTREVRLMGEAFFNVHKDPSRPFLVFTNEIVTRVLGTSFEVRNYRNGDIRVKVRTGKVSVFKKTTTSFAINETSRKDAVVLTPNQQVVYERNEKRLTKSLIENPDLLVPAAKFEFEFTDKHISEVFELIEEAYGVEIVYDPEVMKNCYLNASLSDVGLSEKLKLICMGIDSQYEIIDTRIVVYSKGCD